MTCNICIKYEKEGSYVTGCKNMKIQSIQDHNLSKNHMHNAQKFDASQVNQSSSSTDTAVKTLSMLNTAAFSKLKILFANAHFIAKLGRPYTDYVQLCKLDASNKMLQIGNTYVTDKYCQVFIRSIADTIRNDQDVHVADSPFISVISDGSTDTASKETECILLRSASKGKVLTQFIGVRHVSKADADHITRAIASVLSERYEDSWIDKLVALGCDGASVMLGRQRGVAQKLRELTKRPFLFAVHCSAHRIKKSPAKVHQKTEALLLNLYLFYKLSPLNRANLKESFETLGLSVVVPTRVGGTRWLPHTRRALKNIIYGKSAILQHLEQMQNPCDSTHRKESSAKARNFITLLKDPEVLVWLHFLMDVVSCLSTVSESIQKQNATLADVWVELESAKQILSRYVDSKGSYLKKVESTGVVEVSRKKFLQALVEALDNRFQSDLHLFKGSSFMSFMNWPETIDTGLGDYGDENVAALTQTCAPALQHAGCDIDSIDTEWTRFKSELYNSKKTVRGVTWSSIWATLEDKFPNLSLLISLLLTLPSSSVDAERGFSRMKIQKSDWRSRLGDSNLSDLILISVEGPEIGQFQPEASIQLWESRGCRTRRPFFNDKDKPKVMHQTPAPDASDENEAPDAAIPQGQEAVEYEQICDDLGEESGDDDLEEDIARQDLIALQNKSYRLLVSLVE